MTKFKQIEQKIDRTIMKKLAENVLSFDEKINEGNESYAASNQCREFRQIIQETQNEKRSAEKAGFSST